MLELLALVLAIVLLSIFYSTGANSGVKIFALLFAATVPSLLQRTLQVPLGFSEYNLMVLIFLLQFMSSGKRRENHGPKWRLDRWLMGLMIAHIILSTISVFTRYQVFGESLFVRPDIFTSYVIKPTLFLLMFLFGAELASYTEKRKVIVRAAMLTFLVITLSVLPDWLSQGVFGSSKGVIGERNELASYIVSYVPLICLLAGSLSRKGHAAIMLLGLAVIVLVTTLSRGGYLAASVVIVLYLLLTFDIKKLVLPLLIIGGVSLNPPDAIVDRLNQGEQARGQAYWETVSSGRTLFWSGAYQFLSQNPNRLIWGGGRDVYRETSGRYTGRSHNYAAHNAFVSIATDQGLLGLAVVLAFLLRLTYLVIKVPAYDSFTKALKLGSVLSITSIFICMFLGNFGDLFLGRQTALLLFFIGMLIGQKKEPVSSAPLAKVALKKPAPYLPFESRQSEELQKSYANRS